MKHFKLILVSIFFVLASGFFFAAPTLADDGDDCEINNKPGKELDGKCLTIADYNVKKICKTNPDASVCKGDLDPDGSEGRLTDTFRNVINLIIFAIGIIAVISIIISGMKFASSHGDSNAVSKARTQLIYSVVGLIIAALAFAIVNFVITRLNG